MASKRAAVPKPQPELYFERVPVEVAKGIAKIPEKKPKVRPTIRRPSIRER